MLTSQSRSILLIEDSDTQALLLTDVLEGDGIRVNRAASAEESYAAALRHLLAAALSD